MVTKVQKVPESKLSHKRSIFRAFKKFYITELYIRDEKEEDSTSQEKDFRFTDIKNIVDKMSESLTLKKVIHLIEEKDVQEIAKRILLCFKSRSYYKRSRGRNLNSSNIV